MYAKSIAENLRARQAQRQTSFQPIQPAEKTHPSTKVASRPGSNFKRKGTVDIHSRHSPHSLPRSVSDLDDIHRERRETQVCIDSSDEEDSDAADAGETTSSSSGHGGPTGVSTALKSNPGTAAKSKTNMSRSKSMASSVLKAKSKNATGVAKRTKSAFPQSSLHSSSKGKNKIPKHSHQFRQTRRGKITLGEPVAAEKSSRSYCPEEVSVGLLSR
jgi:hypothetical protein